MYLPLTQNYDLISLDLGKKLPFMLKRNAVYEALRKGKYFEVQYDSLFNEENRVVAMTNIINLIKATNGKNIIVSSNAATSFTLRTPYDVAALMATLGLPKNEALKTMGENVENMIKCGCHRKFFKSTISELTPCLVEKLGKRIQKHRQRVKELAGKKGK